MVVVVGINEKARGKNKGLYESDVVKDRMLSLEQYLKIARQIIGKFALASVRNQMLRDEDAIAFIAEHLMAATVRFEEDSGRTFKSYLNQCGIWAINRWLTNVKSAAKLDVCSLDFTHDNEGIKRPKNLHEVIPDKDSSSILDSLIAKETIDEILSHPCLNDAQRKCLKLKFIDDLTYREIAEHMSFTRARAEQVTKEALRKLNENVEV